MGILAVQSIAANLAISVRSVSDAQHVLPGAVKAIRFTVLRRSGCRRIFLAGYPMLAALKGQEAILSGWNQVSCL